MNEYIFWKKKYHTHYDEAFSLIINRVIDKKANNIAFYEDAMQEKQEFYLKKNCFDSD